MTKVPMDCGLLCLLLEKAVMDLWVDGPLLGETVMDLYLQSTSEHSVERVWLS